MVAVQTGKLEVAPMSALVTSGHLRCNRPCPLYPRKRTCAAQDVWLGLTHCVHMAGTSGDAMARQTSFRHWTHLSWTDGNLGTTTSETR